MISEVTFSKKYTSFWNQLLPNANNFIRVINGSLIDDVYSPIELPERKNNIAFVNELAFKLFTLIANGKMKNEDLFSSKLLHSDAFISAYNATDKFLSKFNYNEKFETPLQPAEIECVKLITTNIISQYSTFFSEIEVNPLFSGCGFINHSRGDIYVSGKLIEIKSGGRKFNIYDFRQVLVYCMLDFYSNNRRSIDTVELFNPRMGIIYTTKVENLCKNLSSLQPQELFFEIKEAVTDISFIESAFL